MEDIRYPKQQLDHRRMGKRKLGRPLKRLLDVCGPEFEQMVL